MVTAVDGEAPVAVVVDATCLTTADPRAEAWSSAAHAAAAPLLVIRKETQKSSTDIAAVVTGPPTVATAADTPTAPVVEVSSKASRNG